MDSVRLDRRETIRVEDESGDEIKVYNAVSVTRRFRVDAVSSHEEFQPMVTLPESERTPDYVTPRVKQYLWDNFTISVEDLGIEVVDPEDEAVTVL